MKNPVKGLLSQILGAAADPTSPQSPQHPRMNLTGVPDGYDALMLARIGDDVAAAGKGMVLHVARDDRRLAALEQEIAFFAPKTRIIPFPAWDTVPYDRVSPNPEIVSRRITSLARLALAKPSKSPTIVLTTVNAILQRIPTRQTLRRHLKPLAPGQRIDLSRLAERLTRSGFVRTGTVMEPGEFAVRGGIIDIFPPGRINPVRLDFFGDTLESIKSFDAETQRTNKTIQKLILMPISEVTLDSNVIQRFRTKYVALFGGATSDDPFYQAITENHSFPGQEHWLPLFHDDLETLFDYVSTGAITLDEHVDDAVVRRLEQISEHYEARAEQLEATRFGAPPYKPVPTEQMFLTQALWDNALAAYPVHRFLQFEPADRTDVASMGGHVGRSFAPERTNAAQELFPSVVAHIGQLIAADKRVIIAAWSPGSRERIATLLAEAGLKECRQVDTFADCLALPGQVPAFVVLGLEHGFETPDLAIIAEQDILGDRLVRSRRRVRKATDVITEATSLNVNDLVVHADHGIARFVGLRTIEALGAPHDCLELIYHGGDKLYLPVENIELLSRYGADQGDQQLDRLGGAAWQSRKARLKQRLREIASELIKIAAVRALRDAPVIEPPTGAYEEFVARFPYDETDDQQSSIESVMEDLTSGHPMDRLVCGDVGFGKTEVALRAAFITSLAGYQVAVVVPTTLLARQHFKTFSERFQGFPVEVAQASRLVPPKQLAAVKEGLKSGHIDIVIGTHALLSSTISFDRLGLVVIDEEQHFGVAHKERLKKLREDVHVLTLSATPIPRTLQLALSGVRELSLITTPPVDRLAVRTYISPFDPIILREALRRERFRGGQTYYVVPRIKDLEEVAEFLREEAPDLRVAQAHGQLPPTELDEIMNAFYDGHYDILLSTAIVESGLDVPNANTLIVHRADMFGLAQLYQLRGRVGRSKTRAYAYFTTPPGQRLTEGAGKRLKVLQSLDNLGAGFSLASHDLDIRGGGNLLGEEQSGHIREVGFELYQSMLEEAVATLKGGDQSEAEEQWSPQISLGTSVLIPENYVSDLQLRLGLYRRLSSLETRDAIDAFAAEMIDRFGELPDEVRHLLDILEIKGLCRQAGITQIDAGPKGALISFRNGTFAAPEELIHLIQKSQGRLRVQPDNKLVFKASWDLPEKRLVGVRRFVTQLAELAAETRKAA